MSRAKRLVFPPDDVVVRDEVSGLHNYGSTLPTNSSAKALSVVGASSYIRDHVQSQTILQTYDVYLLFQPTATQKYKMSVIGISRATPNEYVALTAEGKDTTVVSKALLAGLSTNPTLRTFRSKKLMAWMLRDLNKLSKISLRDVLHLAPYTKEKPNDQGSKT